MTQEPASIVYQNVLPWRGCEKLYLNDRTADVFFIFESEGEDAVKIPAHKSILSANSEAFDAMFYGPAKQEGNILIGDATSEAFKEFLQFFYLATVKLTAENAAEVWNLGKQYLVDDCCMASSNISEQNLTLDNMCWGYELAILFYQDNLKKFCEQKISENAEEIFQSNSFLSCGSNVLRHILQLNSFNCDESVVFDGCIAWARAACIQKGLDETNMENLREQLGDLFYEIRFGEMTTEHFYPRYRFNENLFLIEEFKDIIGMIASKDYQPPKFNRNARMTIENSPKLENNNQLICDRIDPTCLQNERYDSEKWNGTYFSSNCAMLLKTIYCVEVFRKESKMKADVDVNTIPTVMKVVEYIDFQKKDYTTMYSGIINLQSKREAIIHLPTPIIIRPYVKYGIIFVSYDGCYTLSKAYKRSNDRLAVQMEQGVVIEFHDDLSFGFNRVNTDSNLIYRKNRGLVKKIIFMKPEE